MEAARDLPTLISCVAAANDVSKAAQDARETWASARASQDKLEALFASAGDEAKDATSEEPVVDPLHLLGACVHFVVSTAEYVSRHTAEGRLLPSALRVLVAEHLASALLEGPHAALVRKAFPVLGGDTLREHLRRWVLRSCADALEQPRLAEPDATAELLAARLLLSPKEGGADGGAMPDLVAWFFARRMAAVDRIEAAGSEAAPTGEGDDEPAAVPALQERLAELSALLQDAQTDDLRLLGGHGAPASANGDGTTAAAGGLLASSLAAPLASPLAGCCTDDELLARLSVDADAANVALDAASAPLLSTLLPLVPPMLPAGGGAAAAPSSSSSQAALRAQLVERAQRAAASLLKQVTTEAQLMKLLTPPTPTPPQTTAAAKPTGAATASAAGAPLRGAVREIASRLLQESLLSRDDGDGDGEGGEGGGSQLLSLLEGRIASEVQRASAGAATAAAVAGGPQEAAGGGAAVAVAMAWRAADVASSAQLAQCAGWMRAVSDTLSVRAMQVCQLLVRVEAFGGDGGALAEAEAEAAKRRAAAGAVAYGAACVRRLAAFCETLLAREAASTASQPQAKATDPAAAADPEAEAEAEAEAAEEEERAAAEAAAAAVRLAVISQLLGALAQQHLRLVATLRPASGGSGSGGAGGIGIGIDRGDATPLHPPSQLARQEAIALQLKAADAAAARLCAPIAVAVRRGAARWLARLRAAPGATQLTWQPAALYAGGGDAGSSIMLPHQPSEHVLGPLWGLLGRLRACGVGGMQPRLLASVLRHARAAFADGLAATVDANAAADAAGRPSEQAMDVATQVQFDLTYLRAALCERTPPADHAAALGLAAPPAAPTAAATAPTLEALARRNSSNLDPISWAVSEAPLQAKAVAALGGVSALLGSLHPELTAHMHSGGGGGGPAAAAAAAAAGPATLRLAPPCARFTSLPVQTPQLRTRRAVLAALGDPGAAGGGAAGGGGGGSDALGDGVGGGGSGGGAGGAGGAGGRLGAVRDNLSSGVSSLLASTGLALNIGQGGGGGGGGAGGGAGGGGGSGAGAGAERARSMLASAQRGAGGILSSIVGNQSQ